MNSNSEEKIANQGSSSPSHSLKMALSYAKRGWPVLPLHGMKDGQCTCKKTDCTSAGKHPRTINGFKNATIDEKEIRQFCLLPSINIGIATGKASGLCVLDVDPKSEGDKSLASMVAEYGDLPKTITDLTGSPGGMHFYFKFPESGMGNKVGFLPGLDIRGEGGYIVAPPSLHKSGKHYTWSDGFSPDQIELAEMPNWLLDLINKPKKKSKEKYDETLWLEGTRNQNMFRVAATLRAGGDDLETIISKLKVENVTRCRPFLPEIEIESIAKSANKYEPKIKKINWSAMKPLPSLEVFVPPLLDEMIPETLRPWITDVAKRMQSSNEMLTAPVLVILSSMIGRKLAIKPKQKDDWKVIPNLWGGIVAPPSAMKSPAMSAALKPIRILEEKSRALFEIQIKQYEKDQKEDGNSEIEKPIRKRRLIYDATIEKLGIILKENPNGLLAFRDELYGFLASMEKKGRENDRQFYLESFNGDGTYVSDRITRDTVDVPALCVSILGGIQPDRISAYFSESIRNGSGDDGFLSRFQVMVYPPRAKNWKLVDEYPDTNAMKKAYAIFNRLDEIDFNNLGFEQDSFDEMPSVRFDSEAQRFFYSWLEKLEKRLLSGEIESPAFEAHLTKYKKLMPSLALIFHVINICEKLNPMQKGPKVTYESAKLAADWCDFLEAHAKKIYADALRPNTTAVHALAKRISNGDIIHRMTVRNLYRKEWSHLRDSKIVRTALGVLESLHWLKIIEESQTGRGAPSEIIYLHPDLQEKKADEQTGTSEPEV